MTETIVHQARSQRGFTLVDTMVTISVMAIVGSMATMQLMTVRRSIQGDGAMRVVMSQLNTAREMAITERRNFEIQFIGGNWLQIVRNEVPVGTTIITKVALESNARYSQVPGVSTDTPDGFGNGAAISFESADRIMFGPDGSLVDSNGNPVNGTVFLAIAQRAESLRAVTVLGATGRVRGYRWNGRAWTRV